MLLSPRAARRICVFTATRAEFGLLRWLLEELRTHPDVELQILVSGTHLVPEFGLTCEEVEDAGFEIDEMVEIVLASDSDVGVAKSMGLGVIGFAEAFQRLRPDVLVLLGDRYEAFAAAAAALMTRVLIAHIHGGEVTEGAMDESMRHAITKMSHLHFVAAEPFRRRVIQLGEEPRRVFTVGAPGLDGIRRLRLLDRRALERQLGIELRRPVMLVAYHPATLADQPPANSVRILLQALDRFPEATLVLTGANADAGGRSVNAELRAFATERESRAVFFSSLGQLRYLSLLGEADLLIGNSSSGLIEAPALKTPTVNLGDRQRGRLRASSVIDCGESVEEISAAIRRALSEDFKDFVERSRSLYGDGRASERIAAKLASLSLRGLRVKHFVDLGDSGARREASSRPSPDRAAEIQR